MMNLIIRPSNLVFRFYLHDGWTKESIEEFYTRGRALLAFPDDAYPYYIVENGTPDKQKILRECFIQQPFFVTEKEKRMTQEEVFDSYWGKYQ